VPRVSVIIPCYNGADLVGRALDSLLTQTYRDFEAIVVDDASTDATPDAVGRKRLSFSLLRYLRRETNGGVAAARNDGIRASSGEFICFLDSDDLYLPRRLEQAVDSLDHFPGIRAVHADCEIRGPAGEVLAQSMITAGRCRKPLLTWRDVALHEPVHTNTITVRRSCFDEVGLFDESLRRGQDSEMWLRLSYRHPIAQLPEVAAIWNRRETSWRSTVIARRAIAVWRAVGTWLQAEGNREAPHLPPPDADDLRFASTRLARAYWRLALALELEEDPEAGPARHEAIAHCLSHLMPGCAATRAAMLGAHLAGGIAGWSACALWARARRAGRAAAGIGMPALQRVVGRRAPQESGR
jgi:hypothetical protein